MKGDTWVLLGVKGLRTQVNLFFRSLLSSYHILHTTRSTFNFIPFALLVFTPLCFTPPPPPPHISLLPPITECLWSVSFEVDSAFVVIFFTVNSVGWLQLQSTSIVLTKRKLSRVTVSLWVSPVSLSIVFVSVTQWASLVSHLFSFLCLIYSLSCVSFILFPVSHLFSFLCLIYSLSCVSFILFPVSHALYHWNQHLLNVITSLSSCYFLCFHVKNLY